jgi:hypothetical protein
MRRKPHVFSRVVPNLLEGGPGNDVIVGGGGLDLMTGGAGGDLMIGSTAFNHDPIALEAIRREWTNPNADFMTTMGDLLFGGGLNGDVKLIPGQTMISDGVVDIITSNGGSNWIWQ